MSFFKRAMMAVRRRRTRTIVMFVIFAAIANMVLAGISIRHATGNASVLARQKLGGQMTLQVNMQGMLQQARQQAEADGTGGSMQGGIGGGMQGGIRRISNIRMMPITEQIASLIAEHENIIGFNYIVNSMGMAEDFEPFVLEDEESTDQDEQLSDNNMPLPGQQQGWGGSIFITGGSGNFAMPDVSVIGVASTALLDAFNNGEARLVEGDHIAYEDRGTNTAVIEQNLAFVNGLKVGDKISIQSITSDEIVLDFTIAGIFETGTIQTENNMGNFRNFTYTQPYNRIYTDYMSAMTLQSTHADDGSLVQSESINSAVYYVDDPKNIDKIKADSESMDIDWELFILDANDNAYRQMMKPIESIASFSKTVVYIVAIAGALLLALILVLSIKERMYETGVLLSMGEGKMKILGQYITEVLMVALVAFTLSIFSGMYISQEMGNKLLERELSIAQQHTDAESQTGQFRGMAGAGAFADRFTRLQQNRLQRDGSNNGVEMIDSLTVKITMKEVLQMLALGLLVIIAGIIIPAAAVFKFNPKTILIKAV